MVLYRCEKCGFEVKDKSRFNRHLNRKYACSGIINLGNDGDHSKKVPPKSSGPSEKGGRKTYICEICNKVFTRKDNLIRHQNSRCKNKMSIEERVKKLESNTPVIYQTINNNTKNISNIESLKIENTININGYGSENLDYITDNYLKNLVSIPYTAIPKLIGEIHCNPNHIENQNIKKLNKKDRFIQYYNGNKWVLGDKKKILEDLVDSKMVILEDVVEGDINGKLKERFDEFKDKFYNGEDIRAKNVEDAEIEILNNNLKMNT